jgi:hypothetical protein
MPAIIRRTAQRCPKCLGRGMINVAVSRLPGATARRGCPACGGNGVVWR